VIPVPPLIVLIAPPHQWSDYCATETFYEHLGKARESSQRAVESARKNGAKETAASWQAYGALHEAEVR
jgi:hypothetical protein